MFRTPQARQSAAVREAFFVSFLGNVGVDADQAFAAGFLFFLVTVVSVGLATLTYLFIERPAMQWASGRKR